MKMSEFVEAMKRKIFEDETFQPPDHEELSESEKEEVLVRVRELRTVSQCYGYLTEMFCGDEHEACMAMLEVALEDWDGEKARRG